MFFINVEGEIGTRVRFNSFKGFMFTCEIVITSTLLKKWEDPWCSRLNWRENSFLEDCMIAENCFRFNSRWIVRQTTALQHSYNPTLPKAQTTKWTFTSSSPKYAEKYIVCVLNTRLLSNGSWVCFICFSLSMFSLNSIAKLLSLPDFSLVGHGLLWQHVTSKF